MSGFLPLTPRTPPRSPRQGTQPHLGGLRGGEEGRLALPRQQLHDLAHLLLKPHLQDAVGLVDDQAGQVAYQEPLGVLQVVQQAPRRGHQQAHALGQALSLGPAVAPAHHQAVGLGVAHHEVHRHVVDLQRQLTRGGDDQHARAVAWHELGAVQQLQRRDQKGERLARACAGNGDG